MPNPPNNGNPLLNLQGAQTIKNDDPSWGDFILKYLAGQPYRGEAPPGLLDIVGQGLPFAGKAAGLLGKASGIMEAGLPFSAIVKGGKVFHGTPRAFDKFNPELYDTTDLLGKYTHLAEEPTYAESYANGLMKGKPEGEFRPNIIPAKVHAKNTLDLVNPNPDDISAVMAAMKNTQPNMAEYYLKEFKRNKREGDEKALNKLANTIRDYLGYDDHYHEGKMAPVMPFDAIRYNDVHHPSWAVPANTPITSAYNDKVPLNDAAAVNIEGSLGFPPKAIGGKYSITNYAKVMNYPKVKEFAHSLGYKEDELEKASEDLMGDILTKFKLNNNGKISSPINKYKESNEPIVTMFNNMNSDYTNYKPGPAGQFKNPYPPKAVSNYDKVLGNPEIKNFANQLGYTDLELKEANDSLLGGILTEYNSNVAGGVQAKLKAFKPSPPPSPYALDIKGIIDKLFRGSQ